MAKLMRFSLLSLWLASSGEASEDDDHGGHGPWEWGGVFELDAGKVYTWSASRVDGDYADPAMKFLAVPASSNDEEGLHGSEKDAKALWESDSWTSYAQGDELNLRASGLAATLTFDQGTWVTLFSLQVDTTGAYAIFCEHSPLEFESDFHFLKLDSGEDVEPGAFEDAHGGEETSGYGSGVGLGVLTAFLTSVPTVAVIVIVGPGLKKFGAETLQQFMFPFASGAMSGAAFFLILPEGLHLAGAGQDEVTGIWTWGVFTLLGWVFCVVVHHFASILTSQLSKSNESSSEGGAPGPEGNAEDPEGGKGLSSVKESLQLSGLTKMNVPLVVPLLIGDFAHNFVDGIVLGVSASLCDASMTWSICVATILHELPQEVSDFAVFVTEGKMSAAWALIMNFLAGQSAVIGAIIGASVEVPYQSQGLVLAFCGGVFVFVSFTELAPYTINLKQASWTNALYVFLSYALGAMLIGLVLLDHKHCAPEGDGHAH